MIYPLPEEARNGLDTVKILVDNTEPKRLYQIKPCHVR